MLQGRNFLLGVKLAGALRPLMQEYGMDVFPIILFNNRMEFCGAVPGVEEIVQKINLYAEGKGKKQ